MLSLRTKDEGLSVPWTYAKVKWFADGAYEGAVRNTNKLRNDGSDVQLHEYRVDKLAQINIEKELKVLSDIHHFVRSER